MVLIAVQSDSRAVDLQTIRDRWEIGRELDRAVKAGLEDDDVGPGLRVGGGDRLAQAAGTRFRQRRDDEGRVSSASGSKRAAVNAKPQKCGWRNA